MTEGQTNQKGASLLGVDMTEAVVSLTCLLILTGACLCLCCGPSSLSYAALVTASVHETLIGRREQ